MAEQRGWGTSLMARFTDHPLIGQARRSGTGWPGDYGAADPNGVPDPSTEWVIGSWMAFESLAAPRILAATNPRPISATNARIPICSRPRREPAGSTRFVAAPGWITTSSYVLQRSAGVMSCDDESHRSSRSAKRVGYAPSTAAPVQARPALRLLLVTRLRAALRLLAAALAAGPFVAHEAPPCGGEVGGFILTLAGRASAEPWAPEHDARRETEHQGRPQPARASCLIQESSVVRVLAVTATLILRMRPASLCGSAHGPATLKKRCGGVERWLQRTAA
jgi:hypothetical protein